VKRKGLAVVELSQRRVLASLLHPSERWWFLLEGKVE